MATQVRDVAEGKLPLTVAFAEEVTVEAMGAGTPYSTYTTASGVQQVLDDSPIKDED